MESIRVHTVRHLAKALEEDHLEGIIIRYDPTLAYDSIEHDVAEIVVTAATSKAVELFFEWMKDRLKKKREEHAVIDGQTITYVNIEVLNVVKEIHGKGNAGQPNDKPE